MKGILGRKSGMTTIFTEEGLAIPVTVIEVKNNFVLLNKTKEKDGYQAVQLGVEDKKENVSIKSEIGAAKKANTTPKYFIKEIRDMEGYKQGDIIKPSDLFVSGEIVDVTGISKGKGFQGSIKRHNQSRGPMAHGSKYHRGTGSLGDIRSTVKKTKKMPGHMGHEQVTLQNLEVISVNDIDNFILIRGSIPGPNKSFVVIKNSIKKLENKESVKMVNVAESDKKNILIEEGKKYNASLNSSMTIEEMEKNISESKIKYESERKEFEELTKKAKELGINKYNKLKLENLRAEVEKVSKLAEQRKGEGK